MQMEPSAEMERSAESSPNAIFTGTTGCPLLSAKATSITSCHGGQWRWRAGTKEMEREERFVDWMFKAASDLTCSFMRGYLSVEVNLCTGLTFPPLHNGTCSCLSWNVMHKHLHKCSFQTISMTRSRACLWSCAIFGLREAAINGEKHRKTER